MSFLEEIHQTYLHIDGLLAYQETESDGTDGAHASRMRELTGYAFFLLLFGQLEDHINGEYEQIIGPWEEAAFLHRVNVVYEEANKTAVLITDYYDLRCDIAHGHAESGQMGDGIRIPEVYEKIRAIMAY